MAVTAAMIKELRELTGVGMSACKNALVETDGNIEEAIEYLRKQGLANAAKKAGRIAAEGLSYAYISDDNSVGVVVEVNSETDFVAKNDVFKSFVDSVAKQAAKSDAKDVEALLEEKWIEDETKSVKEALTEKISVIGENLNIRRFEKVVNTGSSYLVSYIHAGGKIAVLVELATDSKSDALVTAGKNVAMQIASMNPKFVSTDDVPADFIAHEKEVLMEQAKNDPKNSGKPENILEKMLTGRLNKEMKEVCLLEQEYVLGDKISVGQYMKEVSKEIGADVAVKSFVRFETGEGIEKKNENFAEEVAKAMQ
ncbi:MAG: translation elongation factor Ts [Clostridia bacterium]|nr:translation elongation factor Ts [Clostridia bacterium]